MKGIKGIISSVGNIVKVVIGPILGLLNKTENGQLTGRGAILAILGLITAITGQTSITPEGAVTIVNAVGGVITSIGVLVAAIGAQRAHVKPAE